MGRHKKTPHDISRFFRDRADWKQISQTLNTLAVGGLEYVNGNGQKVITQPSIEAIKLILMFSYGRPGEIAPGSDVDWDAQLKAFAELMKERTMKPFPRMDDIQDDANNTDNDDTEEQL